MCIRFMRMVPAGMLLIAMLLSVACSVENDITAAVPENKEVVAAEQHHTTISGYEATAQIIREAEMEALQQKAAAPAVFDHPSR